MTATAAAPKATAEGPSSPVIALDHVSVTYTAGPPWARREVRAVRDVSLSIARGETLGLVGESGSGKTTLGRLMLGILPPTSGRVLVEGEEFARARRRMRGRLQVVLQHPEWSLNPHLHVGTSISEPLAIAGVRDRAEVSRRVTEMLERVGLEGQFAARYPHELSGGQRQRVAIARALITHPRFVVFDEAVSALDVSVQAQILNLIKELQEREGFAALFISHDMAAVRYVSHRVAVMYAGEIVETAPAHRFYALARHPYSRALQTAGTGNEEHRLKPNIEGVAEAGCPLSPRCPRAVERSFLEKPALLPLGDGWVACHRAIEWEEPAPATGSR